VKVLLSAVRYLSQEGVEVVWVIDIDTTTGKVLAASN
jgi:hypothetical protein